ncbi:hypothetical protein CICLE_v10017210mg [Citrus x clementina]|uniref:Uncharacterized protein n=1 Tax=Citrus clementina TaxID=85681 RepID=V4UAI2_CITCL|nr:hypothetical protein CICLE_v10017210mg [Citrus x clementina]
MENEIHPTLSTNSFVLTIKEVTVASKHTHSPHNSHANSQNASWDCSTANALSLSLAPWVSPHPASHASHCSLLRLSLSLAVGLSTFDRWLSLSAPSTAVASLSRLHLSSPAVTDSWR